MTFPDADLPTVVEARFSPAAYTDLSTRLLNHPINVRAGRAPGAARAEPTSCGLTLDNDDAELTPLNVMSTLWPQVKLGTPMRTRIRWVNATFATSVSNAWPAAVTGQTWTNTGTASDYSSTGGKGVHTLTSVSVIRSSALTPPFGATDVTGTFDVSAVATGDTLYVGVAFGSDASNHYQARIQFRTDSTARLEVVKRVAGSDTVLVAAASLGSYVAGTQYAVRLQWVAGGWVRVKGWLATGAEPDAWHTVVRDTSLTSFTTLFCRSHRGASNTNTNPLARFDNVQVNHYVAEGYADSWRPDFITTTTGEVTSTVGVTISGVSRRISGDPKPLRSAPRRYLEALVDGSFLPIAAWTLEDGELSTQAEPTYGTQPLVPFTGMHPSGAVITYPQWGRGTLAPWLPSTLGRSSSGGLTSMWAKVNMPASPTTWAIDIAYASGNDSETNVVDLNPTFLGGAAGWPQLTFNTAGSATSANEILVSFNALPETDVSAPGFYDGLVHHVRWTATQSGADVAWTVHVDGVQRGSGTVTTYTLPQINTIAHTAGVGGAVAIGYLAVWTNPAPVAEYTAAVMGHRGEQAHTRAARLGAENGVTVTVFGSASQPMGPQGVDTLANLLGECEDVDQAVLGDDGMGLGFVCGSARYNLPTALTVDLSTYRTGEDTRSRVLQPIYDDTDTITESTVDRPDGGSATVSVTTTKTDRTYQDGIDANAYTDGQVLQIASARAHRGSVDALRFPNTPIDLRATTSLIGAWQAASGVPGLARVIRTGLPTGHFWSDIDELLSGYSQTLRRRSWTASYEGAPAAPYDVAVYGSTTRVPRYGASSSSLASGITSSATSLSVATATGPLWVTGAVSFDIEIGGERMSVSNISGGSSPQTFTISARSVNGVVKAHSATDVVRLADRAIYAL